MRKLTLSVLLMGLLAVTAWAADYVEVASFDDLAAVVSPTPTGGATTIGGVTLADDGSAYAVMKRTTDSYSWIVKISDFGTASQSISMFYDWGASNLNMGQAFYVNNNNELVIGDGTDDSVYTLDLSTQVKSTYLSKAELLAQSGGDAIMGNYSGMNMTNSELIFYETDMDALWVTNGTGNIDQFISNADLIAAQGNDTVSSALAYAANDNLYWGNNSTDSIWMYDADKPGATTEADKITEVLTAAQITSHTGASIAGFVNLAYNPVDGKIYMREYSSASFLSFDPDDPANTLSTVLTQTQLEAGPAGSKFTIGGFDFTSDGNLVWANNPNGIYMVPEPMTMSLLVLGGLTALRRRRV